MSDFIIFLERIEEPTVALIVHLAGTFDTNGIEKFKEVIIPCFSENNLRFIVDCQNLTYVNSAAIKELLRIYQFTTQKRGALALIGVNTHIYEVLNLIGLTEIIPVYKTREDALKAFTTPPKKRFFQD